MLTAINNSKIDISLKKSTKRLAKDLTFHLNPGDIVFLYGEMGVGKTTFIKYLINVVFPTPISPYKKTILPFPK